MPIEASAHHTIPPSLLDLILGDGTPIKAFFTALVVGTILTVINYGDILLAGSAFPIAKVLLTYCVPYCVRTSGVITPSAGHRHSGVRK